MKKVPCGPTPQGINYPFVSESKQNKFIVREKEDLRIVFSSWEILNDFAKQLDLKENVDGLYLSLPDRKIIWIAKKDPLSEASSLMHEFGHLLGFADISYNKESQAKGYGSTSDKTIMRANFGHLTCDDADGLVAMIYLALGKNKIFNSFCDANILYHNGQL